jgi:hypothetical protein
MKNKAAQEFGKLGGSSRSEAKTQASRSNGAKGGRPRVKAPVPKKQRIPCFVCPDCKAVTPIKEGSDGRYVGMEIYCTSCGSSKIPDIKKVWY